MTAQARALPGRWAGRLPVDSDWLFDVAPAAGLLVLGLLEAAFRPSSRHLPGLVALVFAYSVPLVWRRRWPLPVLLVVIACGPTLVQTTKAGGLISYVLAAMLAAYTAGRVCEPPRTWWGPAIILGVGWTYFAFFHGVLSDFFFIALLYGGAWLVGFVLHRRESHIAALRDEASMLRAEQAEQARHAVEAERARIARELHDIVSHSISVITIQAQALRLETPPERSGDAAELASIETTARQAMSEMRRLLGVLRADGADSPDLAPQPGLADLPALFQTHEATGRSASHAVTGTPTPLPPGLDVTAYRVVQEALTNIRKHSQSRSAHVAVAYDSDRVTLTINDDGPPRTDVIAAGHGLVGMRERVNLYGGSLTVGPTASGGWAVHAVLPLPCPATP